MICGASRDLHDTPATYRVMGPISNATTGGPPYELRQGATSR